MVEPRTEARAWSDVLRPVVQRSCVLADAARPQPIDQCSHAVRTRGLVVNALDRYRSHGKSLSEWVLSDPSAVDSVRRAVPRRFDQFGEIDGERRLQGEMQ